MIQGVISNSKKNQVKLIWKSSDDLLNILDQFGGAEKPFLSQTGETTRIVGFLHILIGVNPWLKGGLGLYKKIEKTFSGSLTSGCIGRSRELLSKSNE